MAEAKKTTTYIEVRNSMIDAATLNARRTVSKLTRMKSESKKERLAREFSREMVSLSVENGIVNKGNLILFDAHELPRAYGT